MSLCVKCSEDFEGESMFGLCPKCGPVQTPVPVIQATEPVLLQAVMPGVLETLENPDVSKFWGNGNKSGIEHNIEASKRTAASVRRAASNPGKKKRSAKQTS